MHHAFLLSSRMKGEMSHVALLLSFSVLLRLNPKGGQGLARTDMMCTTSPHYTRKPPHLKHMEPSLSVMKHAAREFP